MVLARALTHRTGKGKHYGVLTAKFVIVLQTLLWGFHNAATGPCFPWRFRPMIFLLQGAILAPKVEIGPYRAFRRQRLPLTARHSRKYRFKISRTSIERLRRGLMGSIITHSAPVKSRG